MHPKKFDDQQFIAEGAHVKALWKDPWAWEEHPKLQDHRPLKLNSDDLYRVECIPHNKVRAEEDYRLITCTLSRTNLGCKVHVHTLSIGSSIGPTNVGETDVSQKPTALNSSTRMTFIKCSPQRKVGV